MKPFFGFVNNFIIIISCFIAVVLTIAYLIYDNNERYSAACSLPLPEPFCATVSPELDSVAAKGNELFLANCAACHKLHKKATGPALSGVTQKDFPSENYFSKFVLNEDGLKGADRSYAKTISEDYYSDFQHKFKLTETELNELIAYLE